MKLILLLSLGCLIVSGLAGEREGRLAVEDVVSRALAANPTLKASMAKWAAMKERVPQAKAWDDPMVGVDFERMGTTRFDTYSGAECDHRLLIGERPRWEDLSGQVLHDDELSLLLNFPNVLITAHQAFLTREALSEIARVTTENILKLETGEPFLQGTAL